MECERCGVEMRVLAARQQPEGRVLVLGCRNKGCPRCGRQQMEWKIKEETDGAGTIVLRRAGEPE